VCDGSRCHTARERPTGAALRVPEGVTGRAVRTELVAHGSHGLLPRSRSAGSAVRTRPVFLRRDRGGQDRRGAIHEVHLPAAEGGPLTSQRSPFRVRRVTARRPSASRPVPVRGSSIVLSAPCHAMSLVVEWGPPPNDMRRKKRFPAVRRGCRFAARRFRRFDKYNWRGRPATRRRTDDAVH